MAPPDPVLNPGIVRRAQHKNVDLVASSLPQWLDHFPVSYAVLRLQGAPVPGGPKIQAFGSDSWQMRYLFVCLLLREGRWEEEAQGRGVQSLALVECETPGQHL